MRLVILLLIVTFHFSMQGHFEGVLERYFEEKTVPYTTQVRFYTYLYLAEDEATFVLNGIGSLDPLIKRVVETFFPGFEAFEGFESDPFSENVATQVWDCLKTRIEEEERNTHTFTPCFGEVIPVKTAAIAKWIPWMEPLPPLSPPKKENSQDISPQKISEKKMTWEKIARDYMKKQGICPEKQLQVQSILMMALYDCLIATYEMKFCYCAPRPRESRWRSPSYPSGHASQAATGAAILTHFFPEERDRWTKLADAIAEARVRLGVHTRQDIEAGKKLGKEVAEATLKAFCADGEFSSLFTRSMRTTNVTLQ